MKNNQRKHLIVIFSIAVFIFGMLIVWNRYSYGVWNPLSLPDRIQYSDRRYNKSTNLPRILNDTEEPKYHIASGIRTDLYSFKPKGENVPTVIYLKMQDGKYQQYALSGSP